MQNEYQDEQEVLTNPDANVDASTDTPNTNEDTPEVDVNELQNRLNKLESDYQNQKIRAEKAEAKLKSGASTGRGETSKSGELSAFDLIAVAKANLDEDQLQEAIDYAKYKKISVAEALKSPAVKATIQLIDENKKVAEATNVGSGRRGSSKVSDDVLLANARKGEMPESDADIKRLLELRRANR